MGKVRSRPQLRSEPLRDVSSFDLEEYNKIVRKAELVTVRLVNTEFEAKPEFYVDEASSEERQFTYDDDQHSFMFDASKGVAVAAFEWCVDVSLGEKKLMHLKGRWLVGYNNLKSCNENEVRMFVERVGQFAAYPYWRAFVSQMSGFSQARLPILPMLREPTVRRKNRQLELVKENRKPE